MSIVKEEEMMEVLMRTLGTELEAMNTTITNGVKMSGYIEMEEWLEDTFIWKLNFEEWVEKELVEMEMTKMVEPLEITHCQEGFLDLGLEILQPESYATPMKAVVSQRRELWGKTLPNNILMENFGPAFCSTPRLGYSQGSTSVEAATPPTQFMLTSPDNTPSLTLASSNSNQRNFEEHRYINESKHSDVTTSTAGTTTTISTTMAVTNPNTKAKPTSKTNPKPTSVGIQEPNFTTLTESLKPKPWHCGIIPYGPNTPESL
jgi:hypothetical protein